MIHHQPKTLVGQSFKDMASIGRWYFLSHYCSEIVSSQDRRAKLITSAKSFLTQYNMAGIGVDWESTRSAPRDNAGRLQMICSGTCKMTAASPLRHNWLDSVPERDEGGHA